jgi:hypothetical protein
VKKVYAFEWCDCIYESAFGVVSLHSTKTGAYKAMRARLMDEAEEDRGDRILHGFAKGWKGSRFKDWRVREIEVLK